MSHPALKYYIFQTLPAAQSALASIWSSIKAKYTACGYIVCAMGGLEGKRESCGSDDECSGTYGWSHIYTINGGQFAVPSLRVRFPDDAAAWEASAGIVGESTATITGIQAGT